MIILAWSIFIFSLLQLLIAVINLLFQQKLGASFSGSDPLVSVLIPARNEENNLPLILSDLKKSKYKNLEIIVFDDQSTDDTYKVTSDFTLTDQRIKLIRSDGLPEGWLGKNYACYSLAQHARGSYFLFLDADVRISNEAISKSIHFIKKQGVSLMTIFPTQIMIEEGEYMTVPNMNYILLSLLPLFLVEKSKFPSLAAANGQFMLFEKKTYSTMQPHQKMKYSMVEDIHIARWFKQEGIKVACLTGIKEVSCRMYHNFSEAISGFSKNVIMFFGNSYLLAFLFWGVTTLGFIPVLLVLPLWAFWLYLFTVIAIRFVVSLASGQNWLKNILLIVPQQLSLGLMLVKAFQNQVKNNYQWKGRTIS